VWVLVACGCDAVFGLRATAPAVTPPDALATTCPPIGTAPQFSPFFYQVTAQNCAEYSPSADTDMAVASCFDNATAVIEAGPIDQPLAGLTLVAVSDCTSLHHARLAPEGDHLFVAETSYDCEGTNEIGDYALTGGAWTYAGVLAIPQGVDYYIGDFTRAPGRHAMLSTEDGTIHELAEQPDSSWLDVGTYTGADFGLPELIYTPPNLSADGLRALVYDGTTSTTYYIDRPDLASRFSAVQPLVGVPGVADAHLSDDCTHVYFSGVEHVFFVRAQ
jgi:hypothetical protein